MKPIALHRIHAAARPYGVEAADLVQFAGGRIESDGVLYRYRDGGSDRLLKFLEIPGDRPGDLAKVEERIRFMRFLGEHDVPVALPIPSPSGHLFEELRDADSVIVVYAMDLIPGRLAGAGKDGLPPGFVERWGALVGRMHACARRYHVWNGIPCPGSGSPCLHWREEWRFFLEWCRDDDVRGIWEAIGRSLGALTCPRDAFGFIHNDPHAFNILVDGDRLTILDFDVANCHWFMTDIGIATYNALSVERRGFARPAMHADFVGRFLEAFMRGYGRENTLPPDWLPRLDLFLLYRRVLNFIVFYDGLVHKPGALNAFKQDLLADASLAIL